jgi:glycine cleavage system aminomethyltransferase T
MAQVYSISIRTILDHEVFVEAENEEQARNAARKLAAAFEDRMQYECDPVFGETVHDEYTCWRADADVRDISPFDEDDEPAPSAAEIIRELS